MIVGMGLIAHLRLDAFFLSDRGHHASFPNSMGERLLAIDMFAGSHRLSTCVKVVVIRRGNDDRIDFVVQIGDHLAIVSAKNRIGIGTSHLSQRASAFVTNFAELLRIHHIHESDDIEPDLFGLLQVCPSSLLKRTSTPLPFAVRLP